MKTVKERIYDYLKEQGRQVSVTEVAKGGDFGARPYVSKMLRQLLEERRVKCIRIGRYVYYELDTAEVLIDEDVILSGLDDELYWSRLNDDGGFFSEMSEQAKNAIYFGFTEMLNNAVDHSKSGAGYVKIWHDDGKVRFIVRDRGIGVFRNVMVRKGFDNVMTAIQNLLKGKLTTMPAFHSGEGIFWTSKIADKFVLSSYDYRLTVDGKLDDYMVEKIGEEEMVLGTMVYFEISEDTTKSLSELFREYSFDKKSASLDETVIPVKLYEEGEVWISRSQAKKVLAGLEKFKRVVFDFKGI